MRGSGFLPLLVTALTPFLVLTTIVVASGSGGIAWKPPVLWAETFGNSSLADSATVIASDSSGVYVEGYANSSGPFAGGPGDLFLNKYDSDGHIIWTRTIGDTNNTFINGMSVGADGIYLSQGYLTGSSIRKYDLTGNELWERKLDIARGEIDAISSTSMGLYVAGTISGIIQPKQGYAMFIRQYDGAGTIIWTNEFYNSSYYGDISGLYSFGSEAYIVGHNAIGMQNENGKFLIKYDQNGHLAFSEQLPLEGATGISGDSSGIYLSGVYLRKFDFTGNLVWQTQIDSPDSSEVTSSMVSADRSGIYVSAWTYRQNAFLARYDLNGNNAWSLRLQPTAQDFNFPVLPYRLTAGLEGVYIAGAIGGDGGHGALVEGVSSSSSLVAFGVNPPLSFVILGGPIGISIASLFLFRKLRRGRVRPRRTGPVQRSPPITD